MAVVEVSPEPFVPAPDPADDAEVLAQRIWRLRRDALRDRYRSLGIAVVEWREGTPLQSSLEEVREFRRRIRHT